MFDLSRVPIGLWVDPVPEFVPSRHNLLQPAHRCIWSEASAEQGRIDLHGSSGGSLRSDRGHLRSSIARLLQFWAVAPSRGRDFRNAEEWAPSKYAHLLVFLSLSCDENACQFWMKEKKNHTKNSLVATTIYNGIVYWTQDVSKMQLNCIEGWRRNAAELTLRRTP